MEKKRQTISVYNVQSSEMAARLSTIKGLKFGTPRVGDFHFTEVEIIDANLKQWGEITRLW